MVVATENTLRKAVSPQKGETLSPLGLVNRNGSG